MRFPLPKNLPAEFISQAKIAVNDRLRGLNLYNLSTKENSNSK